MQILRSIKGMTMVELMAAVVIVGVVTGYAAPLMSKAYERMQFSTEHRGLISTLRLARSTAISQKRQIGVYFDETNRIISLYWDRDDLTDYNFAGADSVLRVDTLPSQFLLLSCDLANNAVVFRPNGAAGFVGSSTIWMLAATDKTVAIQNTNILAATGKVGSYSYYY